MAGKRQYIWALIEFTNGDKKWYCISRVLRQSLLVEKAQNKFWKKTMIGNYITVSTSRYVNDRAQLTVGKITKLSISPHSTHSYNWTRNQFVTPDHLQDFQDAFNYLKHDYSWYNRFSIWVSLKYWHNELKQKNIKQMKKSLKRKRWQISHIAFKLRNRS